MKKTRCHVVNDDGIIMIFGAEVMDTVSESINCRESSFVVIKYFKGSEREKGENPIYKIIDIESAYYFIVEE